jgi:hypothetical protein
VLIWVPALIVVDIVVAIHVLIALAIVSPSVGIEDAKTLVSLEPLIAVMTVMAETSPESYTETTITTSPHRKYPNYYKEAIK